MQTRSRRSGNKLPTVWTVVPNPQEYQDRFYWQTWYQFLCTKPEMEARLGCPASNLEGGGTGKYRDFEDQEEDGAHCSVPPACHATAQAHHLQRAALPGTFHSSSCACKQAETPSGMQSGRCIMSGVDKCFLHSCIASMAFHLRLPEFKSSSAPQLACLVC